MSWFDGVPVVLLYAGPPQNYPAANANSSAAQSLIAQASGGASQARIPASYMQLGKQGFVVKGEYSGIVTASTAATTMTIVTGSATAANSTATGAQTLSTSQAVVINSVSAGIGWSLNFMILFRGTGYGTSSVSSSLLTTSRLLINTSTATATATATIAESTPVSLTQFDASVDQWIWQTVTFSTASATNSCTLEQTILYGMS